jgi:hypothetical protein
MGQSQVSGYPYEVGIEGDKEIGFRRPLPNIEIGSFISHHPTKK